MAADAAPENLIRQLDRGVRLGFLFLVYYQAYAAFRLCTALPGARSLAGDMFLEPPSWIIFLHESLPGLYAVTFIIPIAATAVALLVKRIDRALFAIVVGLTILLVMSVILWEAIISPILRVLSALQA